MRVGVLGTRMVGRAITGKLTEPPAETIADR
jgi:hypothetical protein